MPVARVHIRPPQRIPQHIEDLSTISLDDRHVVTIKHPGYENGKNILLVLPALDEPQGGLDHETALVACGMIAGNQWDGFFTSEKDGDRLDRERIPILPTGSYFFYPYAIAGISDEPYPIVPCFSQWPYPHDNFPPLWKTYESSFRAPLLPSSSNTSAAVAIRDRSKCRISAHSEVCEMAHLCPASENNWFHSNEMFRYNHIRSQTGSSAIKDINNLILLRSDLHTSFDRRKFVIVPKQGRASQTLSLVPHMLEYSEELAKLYHNVNVSSEAFITPAFLLARFAWALFPFVEGFLQGNTERALLINGEIQLDADAHECRSYTRQVAARSRTNSSKKRAREDDCQDTEQDTECGLAPSIPEANQRKRERGDDIRGCKQDIKAKRVRLVSATCQDPRSAQGVERASTAPSIKPSTSSAATTHELPDFDPPSSTSSPPPAPRSLPSQLQLRTTPHPYCRPASIPSPTTPHLTNAAAPSAQITDADEPEIKKETEDSRLETLKLSTLAVERQRSDALGSWQKELEWAWDTIDAGPMDPGDVERIFEILGG